MALPLLPGKCRGQLHSGSERAGNLGEGVFQGAVNCGAPGTFCGMGERRAWAWVRLILVAILALDVPAVSPQVVEGSMY